MANGDMLKELQSIFQGETDVPKNVANRMLLAGMVELHSSMNALKDSLASIDLRVHSIETARAGEARRNEEKALEAKIREEERDKRFEKEKETFFSWKDLAKEVALPVVMVIVSVIITLTLTRGM